jgi:methylated-DNA-protein-cysteine methyltransferase-like protein
MANSTQNQSSIYELVYDLVKKVPYGKVITYGLIAEKVRHYNKKLNGHVVGWVLHRNDNPLVPCHRVVDRNGRLAPNFAVGGAKEQRARLRLEGVKFIDDMHIDLKNHLWII